METQKLIEKFSTKADGADEDKREKAENEAVACCASEDLDEA